MTVLMYLLGFILLAIVGVWALDRWFMQGSDLTAFDGPIENGAHQRFLSEVQPSAEHGAICERIVTEFSQAAGLSEKQRTQWMRTNMDKWGLDKSFDCRFIPVEDEAVSGEWVIAPGADSNRRVYYIHGGAFIAGSPLSHRPITSRLSAAANAPVFSVDYRLMPENARMAGIEDTRKAYQWVLENGPDGPAQADALFIGGDSAGGNLVLALASWVRDSGLPSATGVFAFSPLTDSTFSSPSIRSNVDSDTLLGPIFRPLMKIPPWLLRQAWVGQNRMRPVNPDASPVFADLGGLPPLLIQASESEMMLDDSHRYVNKARSSGTDARLQTWNGMLHAWQMFQPEVPEANQAWDEMERWFQSFQSTDSPS